MTKWLQVVCVYCRATFRISSEDMGDADEASCPRCEGTNSLPQDWARFSIFEADAGDGDGDGDG